MMRKFILFTVIGFSCFSIAQVPPGPRPTNPEYQTQSKLVVLRFVPMDKKGKLFLAGNKAADIDFRKGAKIVDVTILRKNQKKDILQVTRVGDSFQEYEIVGLPPSTEPYDLQIRTEVRGKYENMEIRVQPTKP